MTDFTHKGVTITVTQSGTFQYYSKHNKLITKPSLKAAQTAINKEVGAIPIPAMSENGRKFFIVGKHRTKGYISSDGLQVATYLRLLPWNDEAMARLEDIRDRECIEGKRHRDAMYTLASEKAAIIKDLGAFDYDAAVKAELARQKTES